jgi:transcriptional regulator with XRE-family HTH domain
MEKKSVSVGARLRQVMDERGLRAVDLHDMIRPYCAKYGIGISKSQLSQYLNDFNEPGQRRLFILAQALDVSEAWLLGFDVPRERKAPAATTDERAREFAQLFQRLTPEQQKIILQSMKGILADQ